MALVASKVKTPLGMQTLDFWPITAEPENAHPAYDASVNLGAAVKGYLAVTTASASIPGDDIVQVEDEVFTGEGRLSCYVNGNHIGNKPCGH